MAFIKPSKILNPNNTANRRLGTSPGNRLTQPRLQTGDFSQQRFDPISPLNGERDDDEIRISGEDDVTGGGRGPGGLKPTVSPGGETGIPAPNLTEDFNLGEFIADALRGGSAFNSETFAAGLEQLQNREARRFETRGADIEADVARRGLSASTIPTGFIEQSKEQRAERLQSGEANLLFKRAEAEDAHLQSTLQNANIFLDSQNRTTAQKRRDDILLLELSQAKDEAAKDRALEKWLAQQ